MQKNGVKIISYASGTVDFGVSGKNTSYHQMCFLFWGGGVPFKHGKDRHTPVAGNIESKVKND